MNKTIWLDCAYHGICKLRVENEKLREAFGLARSMILAGENITPEAEKIFEQALAKLKEEPEPSEFTKNIIANLERWDSDLSDARIKSIIAWLKEVCRRYDWLVKTISQLRQQKTSIISQLEQQIEQLQAENKQLKDAIAKGFNEAAETLLNHLRAENEKLVEGQKAKKEAGS